MEYYRAQLPSENHWFEQIKCQAACPVHTDARGYVQAVARGDYEQAYLIARAPNPLASMCGRICGAPCESACCRGEIDNPIQIRALKRFVTEKFGAEAGPQRVEHLVRWLREKLGGQRSATRSGSTRRLFDPNTRSSFRKAAGQKIAIVGSGPAGLAAGHDLALMGFAPVIFEMEPVPAGMLSLGVPEYRLPRDLIRAEVELIEELGVEIRCNQAVGRDISLQELRAEFNAVVLAVGAKRSRMLDIPGADADQVIGGVEFLRDIALGHKVVLGQRVVVIGGGNVAFDVGRSVIRNTQLDVATLAAHLASVTETHICCLESHEEMPADDVEIIEASEEGIRLHSGLGPREIHTENGRVTGVTFVRCTQVFDEQQRFNPKFDETQHTTLECETVILAIGQRVDVSFIDSKRAGLALLPNGAPKCDPVTLETTAENVFVAGDLAYGTKLLIHAVASGKQVARSIYKKFTGEEIEPRSVELHVPIEDYAREYDYEQRQRVQLPVLATEERVRDQSTQVELTLLEQQARYEASRCLNCGINTIFDGNRCILCGGCVDICPSACLKIVNLGQVESSQELANLRETLFAGEPALSVILKDDDTCIRCGLCAARCPVSAITMEEYYRKELAA
ncbi:MAG: FAD-dependent oxidoreductase [bacterium]